MWKKVQGNVEPSVLEERPQEKLVYVRKNIHTIQVEDATLYEYDENCISQEDWEIYRDIFSDENDITDLQMTVIDLYEMIIGS